MTRSALAASPWPGIRWETARPGEVGLNSSQLAKARDFALRSGGSGIITRHGKVVMTWGDQGKRYDLKSTTKSIGVTALGLAIADGKMKLPDKAIQHHPDFGSLPETNKRKGWLKKITLFHLATQTAGFEKPGGYRPLTFSPGTKWAYSDGGPNWLAECVTLAYRRDVKELLQDRVFTPIGVTTKDLTWRRNAYRPADIQGVPRREFGSGISANVDAMARIGYLYLREGKWKNGQLIPAKFVAQARSVQKEVVGLAVDDKKRFGNASDHYGLLWWNNADGALPGVPRDAYWSWGLYESLIVVIPSLDMVVARAGKSFQRQWDGHYRVLEPFLGPIAASAQAASHSRSDKDAQEPSKRPTPKRPIPPSPVIRSVEWAPVASIRRAGRGGDNWPITWGDDDLLYTAYGDGHGFVPKLKNKLSMGLATISGAADNFRAANLRSSTAERRGDGQRGPKVSGMLMVDGDLYMLVRNTGNAQLAWSNDHGRTWKWSDWKFETSFGYPSFLNFGKNYDGARDDYVYVYSHDSDSAYKRSDRMVLARVPRGRLRQKNSYEFFAGLANDRPKWSRKVQDRAAVFSNPGRCYRSSVVYNAGLGRYLWLQTGLGKDTRHGGGFAIYDAPEPWGPWTEAFQTDRWDVGPGETSTAPTKWMSRDGRKIHLVFSGDDAFSVRQATLHLHRDPAR